MCNYIDKYGDKTCTNNVSARGLCDTHRILKYKFSIGSHNIQNMIIDYKTNNISLNTFVKLFKNLVNYYIVHKEMLIAFDSKVVIDKLSTIIKRMSDSLYDMNEHTMPFVKHKKSITKETAVKKTKFID